MKIKKIATKVKQIRRSTTHTKNCCVIKITLEDKDISLQQLDKLTHFLEDL